MMTGHIFSGGNTVQPRHVDIHGHHVGLQLDDFLHRIFAVARGRDHLDIRRPSQQPGDGIAH